MMKGYPLRGSKEEKEAFRWRLITDAVEARRKDMANADTTRTRRPAVPRRKSVVEQVASDITSGTTQIIQMGKDATARVKEGYRRVRRHMTGK